MFNAAGAVTLGTVNTKDCPAQTLRMTTAAACAAAAALTARPFLQLAASAAVPGGCGWLTAGGSFYFNADPNGISVNVFAQPVCAGAPNSWVDRWADTLIPICIFIAISI